MGRSRRLGLTAFVRSHPWDWLDAAVSVTWVDAELIDPPPATIDQPIPAFVQGQSLPYVAPLTLRLDAGVNGDLLRIDRHMLKGRFGGGFSLLSARPLPFGEAAPAVGLLDLSGELAWGAVALGVQVFNVFDQRYAAVPYNFVSNWRPDAIPSRRPALHIAAGAPLSVMGYIEVKL